MSLYNYFAVKGVSKSSIKKESKPDFELANDDSGSKSVISNKQDIQHEQNDTLLLSKSSESSSKITEIDTLSPEPELSEFNSISENDSNEFKNSVKDGYKDSTEKNILDFGSYKDPNYSDNTNYKNMEKDFDKSKITPISATSQLSTTTIENLTDALHKNNSNETGVKSIVINDPTLLNENPRGLSLHDTLQRVDQEKGDLELIVSDISSLQLEKKAVNSQHFDSNKDQSSLSQNNESKLKQNTSTSNPNSIELCEDIPVAEAAKSDPNEIEYDENNSDHFNHLLEVFEENIKIVMESESNLFSETELQWWQKYNDLSLYAKHILVRLYIKKQAWYRRYELTNHIPNDKIFDECIDELVISALLLKASTETFSLEAILNELSIDELKEVIKKSLSKKARMLRSKQALVNSILKAAESAPIYSMFDTVKENSLGPLELKVFNSCLKVTRGLFSINLEAWKFFNLVNNVFTHYSERYGKNAIMKGFKNKVKNDNYMSYSLTRSGEIFPTSESLILMHSFTSAKLKEILKKIEPEIEIWRQVIDLDYSSYKSNYFLRFTPAFAYTKLINDYYLPCLVKLKFVQEEANMLGELLGQSLFLQNKRANWWNRLSYIQGSILSKDDGKNNMKAYSNCISALEEALSNGIYSENAAELYERMTILERKLNIKKKESRNFRDLRPFMPPVARITGISSTIKSNSEAKRPLWIIESTGESVSTEDFVLNHFAMEDWEGCHSNSTILTTLFALIFLDILFLPLPGVFETPYQTHPLDLGTEAFYLDRLTLIEARLNEISIGNFMELIKDNYEAHIESNLNIIGLDWSHSLNDLIEISYCIGASSLSKIFKLFCLEYFTYTAILPELCIWKPMEQVCKFIKVKTLSETLSDKQRRSIGFLMRCRIRVAVYSVLDPNVKP
ncbi:hypothetical protein CONCODRAFT_80405 [Conidiobolus coronatus NRRL 28638]|uniref:Fanconi-associated nuclease n=1 Tax=Conidiobolus coronatus (strain ATCC 28846 / CBS 209.66 / NRRL 28638) TaxID=796925 RepID=A0A137NVE3_CONC2|nr:hypothetical protein CONCODRAFT_80405 [Conidiobolus coronatus NRRL 28638]|eukprot:KXN66747.1 hypothetical protein CONCODRAFT_80405 [Conidiobolus coronatus NRRL 28638]